MARRTTTPPPEDFEERILETELHRFVRFQYDVVMDVARAK